MNLKFHNPDKLAPSDIGEGYRLLLVTETRVDATHYWAIDNQWRRMPYNIDPQDLKLYDSITYRTDKPLPIPTGSGTPIAKDMKVVSGEPQFWVKDTKILDSHLLTPEVAAQMTAPGDVVDTVLTDRGKSYGKFENNAQTSQKLKAVISEALLRRPECIPDDAAEALDMFCSKISRLVNGDINHIDGWRDIEGFARLVRERIEGNPR